MVDEHIYDYPRRFSLPLELLSAILVALTTLNFGRAVLVFLINDHRLHNLVNQQKPWLRDILAWFQDSGSNVGSLIGLVMPLLWLLLAGLALWQYVRAWITFAYYQFPHIRTTTLEHLAQGSVVSPLGMLLGAHVALLAVAVVVGLLYHLFPNVAADGSGITLTTFGRTRQLSWRDVRVVKATTLSPDRHVVLIESFGSALPWWYRIGPLAYEGGFGRGGLIWPMALNFEALMQRITLELTRQPHADSDDPRLGDWEALYVWRGISLVGGALIGVLFQLLTLTGVALIR